MKTLITAAVILMAPSAFAYKGADDYGSERFAQVNRCMVAGMENHQVPDPKGKGLAQCMRDNNYAFLPAAHVWGDSGPRCKTDAQGVFHSWCWVHVE